MYKGIKQFSKFNRTEIILKKYVLILQWSEIVKHKKKIWKFLNFVRIKQHTPK